MHAGNDDAEPRYAVIFTAAIRALDDEYSDTAARMRELAFSKYRCAGFNASLENGLEIAISYWHDLDDIRAWHDDSEHRAAQALGKSRWYRWFRVEVVDIRRRYGEHLFR